MLKELVSILISLTFFIIILVWLKYYDMFSMWIIKNRYFLTESDWHVVLCVHYKLREDKQLSTHITS